jgi:hypothetical protein
MRDRWRTAVLALWVALAAPACFNTSPDIPTPTGNTPPSAPGPPISNPPGLQPGARVLFIGNSLTEGNDVPGMVRALAAAAGLSWTVEAQLLGGAALQDHWERGQAPARITSGDFDAVVLQQGPSSLPESRASLRQWAGEFDGLVRAAGGRSALYMVWPEQSRFEWFDRVRDSYALAARDLEGWFLPAGEAWREAWKEAPGLQLYGDDGFHPTVAGSWAAALTIFAGLSGRSPLDLPPPPGIDPTTAERLRRAAAEALENWGDYGPRDLP